MKPNLTNLVFLLSALFLMGYKVNDISFRGAKNFSQEKLKKVSGIKKASELTPEIIQRASENIMRFMEHNGALLASVDSVSVNPLKDSSFVNLVFFISGSEMVRIKDIKFQVQEASIDSSLLKRWNKNFKNKVFKSEIQNRILSQPVDELEKLGYPFASSRLIEFKLDNYTISLEVLIEPGARVELCGIKLKGDESVKEELIKRKIRKRFPILYSKARVKEIEESIEKLEFLSLTEPIRTLVDPNGNWWLVAKVAKKKSNIITGAIAFTPSAESTGRLSGNLLLSSKNIINTGRTLEINYLSVKQARELFSVFFKDPFLFAFETTIKLSYEKRYRNYSRDEIELGISYPLKSTLFFSLSYIYTKSKPDSFGYYIFHLPETTEKGANIGLKFEKQGGKSEFPIRQFSSEFGLSYSFIRREKLELNPDMLNKSHKLKTKSRLEYMRKIGETIFDISLSHLKMKSNEKALPFYEMLFLGGAKTLRGYREESFIGDEIAYYRAELRFITEKAGEWIFLFNDGGIYKLKSKWSKLNLGSGAGIRFQTRLGLLEIAYGIKSLKKPTDGNIHVLLLTEF